MWLRGEPRRGYLADLLLAVALTIAQSMAFGLGSNPLWPGSAVTLVAWTGLSMTPIALRRWRPLVGIAVMLGYLLLAAVLPQRLPDMGAAPVVLTYTMAAYRPLGTAAMASTVIWLPVLASITTVVSGDGIREVPRGYSLVLNGMIALASFFLGRTKWNRRAYVAALEDRAHTAEATQRARTEQAVADERRRIARELHDVVAHNVSVMGVLATGCRRTLAKDPATADEALAAIEQTGRTVLRELRRLLDVLRPDQDEGDELTPQPGVSGLTNLVEQVRDAGLPVSLTLDQRLDRLDMDGLDPGVELTVYRVVQEALTNIIKHAGTATADVRLTTDGRQLLLEVCDTGHGPALDGPRLGHGLVGMRERVSLYGGTLRTGPRPGGGYRVCAKIPFGPPEREETTSGETAS